MNKAIVCALVIALVLPTAAMAATLYFAFESAGTAMRTPAYYTGALTWGADGTFSFTLDDTGWPDSTDQQVRWDHIFNTYFIMNYDGTPGSEGWKGEIDGWYVIELSNAQPGYNGTVSGEFRPQITLIDADADMVLDWWERSGENIIKGSFTIACDAGTGEMTDRRGGGSMQSNYMSFPFLPETDVMTSCTGSLNLEDCPVGTEASSWGRVKALYK